MAAHFCDNKLEDYQIILHLHENFLMAFCVLNLCFFLLATVGNLLVIRALWKASSIPVNLKSLLQSLAFSDLAVGLIAQLMLGVIVALMLNVAANENDNLDFLCPTILAVCYTILYLLTCASFLTIMAITVDRLLAIYLHLRYQELVTSKRVIIVLVFLWCISCAAASIFFVLPNGNSILVAVIEIGGLLFTTVAYALIFKTVRHHQIQEQSQFYRKNDQAMGTVRERKSALNALTVYIVFLACFLPNLCCRILLTVDRFRVSFLVANHISGFLVLLNSSLNPLVYCWRYREIRGTVKTLVKKFCLNR